MGTRVKVGIRGRVDWVVSLGLGPKLGSWSRLNSGFRVEVRSHGLDWYLGLGMGQDSGLGLVPKIEIRI